MSDRDPFTPELTPEPDDNAEFADRVAIPLRAPETVSPRFEDRVMATVRMAGAPSPVSLSPGQPGRGHRWWNCPRTFTVAPLAGLAAAAVFAGIVSLGTLAVVRSMAGPVAPGSIAAGYTAGPGGDAASPTLVTTDAAGRRGGGAARDVRFVFVARNAKSVALVGDFNGWARSATPLQRHGNGVWAVSVPLPPGRYEYAFIVDGKRWVADPYAPLVRDDFGIQSSLLTLGAACPSAS